MLSTASLQVSIYFVVRATIGEAELTGESNEGSMVAGVPLVLEVALSDAEWPSNLLTYADGAEQLIGALASDQT